MAQIIVKSKNETRIFPLVEGKPLYVGRSKPCDVILDSPSVSRIHAVILYKYNICGVKDLGSFNGTFLNDQFVQSPRHMTEQDILKISSFIIRFQEASGPAASDTSVSGRILRPDAATYMNSELFLPRAMSGATRGLPEDDADRTRDFHPGSDTAVFLADTLATTLPEATQEPADTNFFKPLPVAQPLPQPDGVRVDLGAEANAVIPLIDPEEVPVLTFAAEPGTDRVEARPTSARLPARPTVPMPLTDDDTGLDPVPISAAMADRIEERLALYDVDAAAPTADREALPRVFKACYSLAMDEPLAQDFASAGVRHGRLFGVGMYLLALREMRNGADADRQERLQRETKLMERLAAEEFRRVYREACQSFLPEHEDMPLAVRAFLRHGMLGGYGWWLRAETRDFILCDCEDHAPLSVQFDVKGTNVLYAEEYLAAVAEMECAPSANPELEKLEWLTIERLADRCYRRIVNAGSYNIRLMDLINSMDERLRAMDEELTANPAATEVRRRWDVLRNQNELIREEIMNSILDAVQQAEGRFRRGELRMPTQAELIEREAASLLVKGASLSGGEPVFMPLILRERFPLESDVVNDRRSLRERVAGLAAETPGLFDRVLNPADPADDHISLRMPPLFVLFPTSGMRCLCALESRGMDGGHIMVPTCYASRGMADSALAAILNECRDNRRGTGDSGRFIAKK